MCQNESSPRSFIVGYPILYFTTLLHGTNFRHVHKIGKKRLLALSLLPACLPVHPSAWNNLAPTGQTFMKFGISVFLKNLLQKSFTKI
jgi:hypothetical protein